MKLRFIAFISAFFLFATSHIANSNPIDITSLTLEELMEIEITTASKISQKKEDVPAAVSVITQEDIRRSGATNIADILRMVPGVNVAKINPSAYGVSIRGFNDLFANKLLVLLDGKTVYNPIFSGVFWERIDTILEDIDRIEVIRGPGASIWGANAVNGIVNIITKDSKDTKGFLGSFSSGTEDRHILQLRYGDSIGSNGSYRIYFKNREVDDSGDIRVGFPVSHEIDEVDDWRMLKGGFRLDIEPNAKDKFTLQGDADRYEEGRLEISQPFVNQLNNCHVCHVSNIKISGASLMWSWYREISSKNKMNMQLSYSNREYSGSTQLTWRVNTYNLEYQQEYNLNSRHHLIWGGGVLYNRINTRGTYTYSFSPEDFNWAIVNSFIQDEITLLPDKLFLTLGSKFEYHEDLDDIYIQPTVRILGKINKSNVIWGAISRAIRTPSWAEKYPDMRYVRVTSLGNVLYTVTRNYNLEPEQLTSYEIGFRTYFEDKASFSTALFFNKYKKLITLPIPTTYEYELIPIPHVVAHSTPVNGMDGESYGVEVEANFKVTNWWKIFCSYAYSELFLHNELEVPTVVWGEEIEGKSPKNTASVRLLFDLPKNFELNIWLRYSDSIPTLKIPSYFTADVSVSWKPTPNLELSISGTNLFDPTHPEYKTFFFVPSGQSEVERSFTATVKYYF